MVLGLSYPNGPHQLTTPLGFGTVFQTELLCMFCCLHVVTTILYCCSVLLIYYLFVFHMLSSLPPRYIIALVFFLVVIKKNKGKQLQYSIHNKYGNKTAHTDQHICAVRVCRAAQPAVQPLGTNPCSIPVILAQEHVHDHA